MLLCIRVIDAEGNTVAIARGEEEVSLVLSREYAQGDTIYLETSEKETHVWLQLDDAMGQSLVLMKKFIAYKIPFGKDKRCLSPKAFSGSRHLLHVRKAKKYELAAYRNLAVNVYDHDQNTFCFPHASTNAGSDGVFGPRNAIDGVTVNCCHGEWPYASWGINKNPDAKLKLDFGRSVAIDRVIMYIRADFPHDNWWQEVTVTCSDGDEMKWNLKKTDKGQEFEFETRTVSWLEISNLSVAEEESPFPALSQIEVYGVDVNA